MEGVVLRGQFTDDLRRNDSNGDDKETEWCDRRLLARIHRLCQQPGSHRQKPERQLQNQKREYRADANGDDAKQQRMTQASRAPKVSPDTRRT